MKEHDQQNIENSKTDSSNNDSRTIDARNIKARKTDFSKTDRNIEGSNIDAKNLLQILPPIEAILDLPFIYTVDHKLTIGQEYIYREGRHVDSVQLLKVWKKRGLVFLKLMDQNKNIFTVDWNLSSDGGFMLWALYDSATFQKRP
jgi:hypothetical protein